MSSTTPLTITSPNRAAYEKYPYLRFVENGQVPQLTEEEFYQTAAKVRFPVSKYHLSPSDSVLRQLEEEVFPMINRDSLEVVGMIIHGAASPEGPFRFNDFLSQQRAAALLKFIKEHQDAPFDEKNFHMDVTIEDYATLCIMMHEANDADYQLVSDLYDKYMRANQPAEMKKALQKAQGGRLWKRLLRHYFPDLRAARLVAFIRNTRESKYERAFSTGAFAVVPRGGQRLFDIRREPGARILEEMMPQLHHSTAMYSLRQPRRELLSVKTNLLFDVAYLPGYDRWCPIPNIALEYYPLHGHFTFGASLDIPWWQDYDAHKYFQLRNWQVETRYYFRSGDIRKNTPGMGAAFRGFYLQAYAHAGVFGICFDADRGWVGEGVGGGMGFGYVMPLSKKGHWRLELGAQVGYFTCKYDPFQYENPVDPTYKDNRYYYKWTLASDLFKKRQYRFNWIGPTRIGITLSYDLFYRKSGSKMPSIKPWEKRQLIISNSQK